MDGGSFSSSIGDSIDFDEKDLSLSDKLKVFKASAYDPDSYVTNRCRQMSEKEIRHLCHYLKDLRKASAEEMRKSVYANYAAFIRTSREISNLEGQLIALRNLLSTRAAIVHGLAEGINVDSLASSDGSTQDDRSNNGDNDSINTESWLGQFIEKLEVLLAERRVDEVLDVLDEGEHMANDTHNKQTLTPSALLSLQKVITEQKQKLAAQLAEASFKSSVGGAELRSAVQALKRLGDGPRAHTLMLCSHQQKLHGNMQGIRPSGTSHGVAYSASLSQLVFSTMAQATSDSLSLFDDEPSYTSELVTWAVNQTENFAHLIKRYVIASPAASGCLRPVAESVHISLGHCSLLEARGLALSPILLKNFKPCVEQALYANIKRIEQCTAALAAADDWSLTYPPIGSRSLGTSSLAGVIASQPKLSSSAHKFNTMVQELCEDISPLEILQLSENTLEGVMQVFNSYIGMLVKALPGSVDNENLEGSVNRIVRLAETEPQQIALLANALLLSDELIPRAAAKLSSAQQSNKTDDTSKRSTDRQSRPIEQRELKRRLQRLVDQLRDSFCRQHALELIFLEDGGVRLSPDMYLNMEGSPEEIEWFPSTVYQEMFEKLTRIASIASDMFVGRERFATILLMRLTETIILWLSEDQNFWEEIEQGPKPLGPLGLQQFYLDMEFVILFASQGRYLSRNLQQVIKNIIGRAIEAVAASHIDPYSVLPEDDWFAEVAQIAIDMLTGKTQVGAMENVNSPTASSVLSHGSN
ncbi:exocyst complex component EXO84A-like [Solanum pennellii]|uniref:Exocyst complex component EXO84A-like n=1 Tax=Solanum pennellii TaxID=28526 RepID=A0ABM1V8T1_SOLPN|nr:exocyst complex component EXO84A-like [Solanum pennellii]